MKNGEPKCLAAKAIGALVPRVKDRKINLLL